MTRNKFLYEYRHARQMTQSQLANEIGIQAPVLARLERNIGNHNARKILHWCILNNICPTKVFPLHASA